MSTDPVFSCMWEDGYRLSVFPCEERGDFFIIGADGYIVGEIRVYNRYLRAELFNEIVFEQYPVDEEKLDSPLGCIDLFDGAMREVYSRYVEILKQA